MTAIYPLVYPSIYSGQFSNQIKSIWVCHSVNWLSGKEYSFWCSCFFWFWFCIIWCIEDIQWSFFHLAFRKLGPLHQVVFFARSCTVDPLVSRSAVFIFVGIYLHWLGSACECIRPTQFPTNGFSLRPWFLIHHIPFMLSHQNATSFIPLCKAPVTLSTSFSHRIVTSNSSQDILIEFKGATLALDISGQDLTSPDLDTHCW